MNLIDKYLNYQSIQIPMFPYLLCENGKLKTTFTIDRRKIIYIEPHNWYIDTGFSYQGGDSLPYWLNDKNFKVCSIVTQKESSFDLFSGYDGDLLFFKPSDEINFICSVEDVNNPINICFYDNVIDWSIIKHRYELS